MVSTEAAGMKMIMNTVATAPSAKAIGMPANMARSVAEPYRSPMVAVVLLGTFPAPPRNQPTSHSPPPGARKVEEVAPHNTVGYYKRGNDGGDGREHYDYVIPESERTADRTAGDRRGCRRGLDRVERVNHVRGSPVGWAKAAGALRCWHD